MVLPLYGVLILNFISLFLLPFFQKPVSSYFIAEYYQKDSYSEYDCNEPLLEHAVLSATSQLRERGPENARLNGKFGIRSMIELLFGKDVWNLLEPLINRSISWNDPPLGLRACSGCSQSIDKTRLSSMLHTFTPRRIILNSSFCTQSNCVKGFPSSFGAGKCSTKITGIGTTRNLLAQ